MKQCPICGRWLDESKFYKKLDRLQSYCIDCTKKRDSERDWTNRKRREYNMTNDECKQPDAILRRYAMLLRIKSDIIMSTVQSTDWYKANYFNCGPSRKDFEDIANARVITYEMAKLHVEATSNRRKANKIENEIKRMEKELEKKRKELESLR